MGKCWLDLLVAGLEVRNNDLVVVERRQGGLIETTVKRVRKAHKTLQLWPESHDPTHQKPIEIGAKGAEVEIKALVISVTTPVIREG